MKVDKVKNMMPLQIFDIGKSPSTIFNEPVPKVSTVNDPKEKEHQALLDANLWYAHMKHERDILELVISGRNYKLA